MGGVRRGGHPALAVRTEIVALVLSAITLGVASYSVLLQRRADRRQTAELMARSDLSFEVHWEGLEGWVTRAKSVNANAVLVVTVLNEGVRPAHDVRVAVTAPAVLGLQLLGDPGLVEQVPGDLLLEGEELRPLIRHTRVLPRLVRGPEVIRANANFMAPYKNLPVEVTVHCDDQPSDRTTLHKGTFIRHERPEPGWGEAPGAT